MELDIYYNINLLHDFPIFFKSKIVLTDLQERSEVVRLPHSEAFLLKSYQVPIRNGASSLF
jgi:hypothetical protein